MPRSRALALLFAALAACTAPEIDDSGPVADWPAYGGDPGGARHSGVTQIDASNVSHLEVAWTYHSGDVEDSSGASLGRSSFQNTPILVDGTLYLCTPFNRVIALDPETGRERWSYDPVVDRARMYLLNCRGVSTWLDPAAAPDAECRRRIITGTLDARLIALDARTGRPCSGFGKGGAVDLRGGIGDVRPGEYGVTSPPTVIGERIVTGAMVLDNRRLDMPGGVVRAFDARTGAEVWAWDPVLPDASGPEAGQRFRRGTTNAWTTFAADPERGLVYVPTGNTSADYFGGHRDGSDHFSSSVVALDADTGEAVWHFQTVHHDVWDYDVPAQPSLFTFPGEAGPVPALAQVTKLGHVFLLDRRSGEPLFPVEERPVPQSGGVPEDTLSPTQPFPTRPPSLHPASLDPDDAWAPMPWSRGACRDLIASYRSDGIFTPPGTKTMVQYPGAGGGMNWGSASVDPARNLLVVNTMRTANLIRLVPRAEYEAQFPDGPPDLGYEPQEGTPYALERTAFLSPDGVPCTPPPWGTLVGVDVAKGEIRWEVPLGTARGLVPAPLWWFAPEGMPNFGGPITTASGLTFIAAATDRYLRAFDTNTGEELWRGDLPFGGQATPMTYRLSSEGRQYVVIAAGGHWLLPGPVGDAVVAFALPR
jgi:quinoprotein glucose dehydrogenase